MFRIEDYLNLEQTAHASFIRCVWNALGCPQEAGELSSAISFHVDPSVDTRLAAFVGENVSIGEGTRIEAGAVILFGLRHWPQLPDPAWCLHPLQRDRGG